MHFFYFRFSKRQCQLCCEKSNYSKNLDHLTIDLSLKSVSSFSLSFIFFDFCVSSLFFIFVLLSVDFDTIIYCTLLRPFDTLCLLYLLLILLSSVLSGSFLLLLVSRKLSKPSTLLPPHPQLFLNPAFRHHY